MRILPKVQGMIAACDGILQVAENRIDPFEAFHLGALSGFTNDFTLMDVSGLRHCLKTEQSVRDNSCSRLE